MQAGASARTLGRLPVPCPKCGTAPRRLERVAPVPVPTRRRRHELSCNRKLLVENAHEPCHTGVVHGASLGEQHAQARDTRGNWELLFRPPETSVAGLPGESTAFAHIEGPSEELAGGTCFTLIDPNTHFACVQDCMWWMSFIPTGAESCIGWPARRVGLSDGVCVERVRVDVGEVEPIVAAVAGACGIHPPEARDPLSREGARGQTST